MLYSLCKFGIRDETRTCIYETDKTSHAAHHPAEHTPKHLIVISRTVYAGVGPPGDLPRSLTERPFGPTDWQR